jgi:hypothetical protein
VLVHDLLVGRHGSVRVVEIEVVGKVVLSVHGLGELALNVDLLAGVGLSHGGHVDCVVVKIVEDE